MNSPLPLDFMDLGDRRVAVRIRPAAASGSPTILFLPGYASDMEGAKALAVDQLAAELGCGCLRLDYSGTGSSGGPFAEGTLERWLQDALAVVDRYPEGPLVLVGSSMGGWLMIHLALARAERVKALIGIAAAPDFTDWGYSDADKQQIDLHGQLQRANPYGAEPSTIHRGFWQSGQSLLLLGGAIEIEAPVRLLHGDQDADVPLDVAHRLMAQLRSADVQLTIVKGGGHRLSAPHEIAALRRLILPFVEPAI